MPLFLIPLALGATSIITGLVGAGKACEGMSLYSQAREIGEKAQATHEQALSSLARSEHDLNRKAQASYDMRARVCQTTMQDLVALLAALKKRGSLEKLQGFQEFHADPLLQFSMPQMQSGFKLANFLLGAAQGAMSGLAGSATAAGAVAWLGTAGTGAAISGLSGAAATNATLAFLGGGTLAAGGGGMALGSAVLTGVAAGPAICITGFVLAGQGQEALTKACDYQRESAVKVAKIRALNSLIERAGTRIDEIDSLITRLECHLKRQIQAINPGTFETSNATAVQSFRMCVNLGGAVMELIRIPIIDREGKDLSHESTEALNRYKNLN